MIYTVLWEIFVLKIAICTLGCKVNYYESRAICDLFLKKGYSVHPFEKGADIYIINTCAVTKESERKASQMVRRALSFGTGKVIVTGCSSQLHPELYEKMDGVYFVCGNREKLLAYLSAFDYEKALERRNYSLTSTAYEDMSISGSERTRAYVKVEDGCDSKCAYCIIKDARGRIRSRSIDDSVREIKALAALGYKEIVLCGIEISGFGKDTGESLITLIEKASEVEGIERIRLSSIDPAHLRADFIDGLSKIDKFMPYFHLSLQSGSSSVLARMRRKYNAEKILSNTAYAREKLPLCEFCADIIVGFPGESDSEFLETCDIAEKVGLQSFHIFTYSKRPGTEAAEMSGQVDPKIKREREKTLSALRTRVGRSVRSKYVGSTLKVLFETFENGIATGHTENFIEVSVSSEKDLRNTLCNVRIKDVTDDGCIG